MLTRSRRGIGWHLELVLVGDRRVSRCYLSHLYDGRRVLYRASALLSLLDDGRRDLLDLDRVHESELRFNLFGSPYWQKAV